MKLFMDYQPDEGLLGLGLDVGGTSFDLDLHWPGTPFHLFEFYVQAGTFQGAFTVGLLFAGFGVSLYIS